MNLTNLEKLDKSGKIVEGTDCDPEVHKFMVVVRTAQRHLCGGTIINKNWVLTASHCCRYRMWVIAGVSKDPESKRIIASVKKCYRYPSLRAYPLNDIALLKLATPIHENEHVKYVKIPNQTVDQLCIQALTMGWGKLMYRQRAGRRINLYPRFIQCVMVPLISARRCEAIYPSYHSSQICSISFEGKDACSGDSGGPLLCDDMQVGIVVYGVGCGLPFRPGIYLRVDHFLKFIDETMMNSSKISRSCFYKVLTFIHILLAYFLYS